LGHSQNKDAWIDIQKDKGAWYRSISQGMGATLNMAGETDGYALTDRGTWISFKRKGDLQILVEGDRRMFNQYDTGEPEQASEREKRVRAGFHRLAGVARRPKVYRQLQD
jgi:ABC-type tungstate transport system permease subunit